MNGKGFIKIFKFISAAAGVKSCCRKPQLLKFSAINHPVLEHPDTR
jgi:hypothetical protein